MSLEGRRKGAVRQRWEGELAQTSCSPPPVLSTFPPTPPPSLFPAFSRIWVLKKGEISVAYSLLPPVSHIHTNHSVCSSSGPENTEDNVKWQVSGYARRQSGGCQLPASLMPFAPIHGADCSETLDVPSFWLPCYAGCSVRGQYMWWLKAQPSTAGSELRSALCHLWDLGQVILCLSFHL